MKSGTGENGMDIKEYIKKHNREEHNYLSAQDTTHGEYDICCECDCIRYENAIEWIVR